MMWKLIVEEIGNDEQKHDIIKCKKLVGSCSRARIVSMRRYVNEASSASYIAYQEGAGSETELLRAP